jgi:uncharacterized protein YndB with AHSA1/START domain
MQNSVELKKSFPLSKQELFRYFTDKSLVEKWSAPDGMTLNVPILEARPGGKYRYEHSSKDGRYVCDGHYVEVSPDRIVQIDDKIVGPDGKVLSENLECTVTLTEKGDDTEVQIVHTGFKSDEEADGCRQGWQQCLARLDQLLKGDKDELLAKPA